MVITRGTLTRPHELKRNPLLSPVSSRHIFVFALSQFSGPDYIGAWNRLRLGEKVQNAPQQSYLLLWLMTGRAFCQWKVRETLVNTKLYFLWFTFHRGTSYLVTAPGLKRLMKRTKWVLKVVHFHAWSCGKWMRIPPPLPPPPPEKTELCDRLD